ncbi:TolC family protein [Pedobacter sp. L105]|uniref:TolC family protein n=1 Tax=Pedobacter sp. L105 TaxID=1641871 RepID=UPI00131C0967|nr:TolC family protein [Pedobacter sp. L105]
MRLTIVLSVALALAVTQVSAQQKLSLQQSKDIANSNNISLKNSGLRIGFAEEGKKAAYSSYLPKVDANGVLMYGFRNFIPAIPPYLPQGVNNFFLGTVTAQQPIYAGGKINTNNELAKLQLEVNKTRLKQAKDSVNLITEQKYLQLININEQYKTVISNTYYLDTLYKEMGDYLKSGLIAKNELLKVKVQRNNLLLNKSKISNMKQVALLDFCQFIGIPFDPGIQFTDSVLVVKDPAALYIKPETVLNTTDDYKLLQKNVSAETLQTKLKRADYLPSASVGVSASQVGVIDRGLGSRFTPLAFGVVSIPISGWWGEGKHILRQRKIAENIAANNLADGSNLLQVRMLRSWYDLTEAFEQYGILEDNLLSSSENLKVERDNYRSGLNNLSDLLKAQADFQQTESELAEAKVNYQIKLSAYRYVTGKMEDKQ